MSTRPTPQDLVERALQASTADQTVVLVSVSTTANLRWANNTLTTNGMVDSMAATVISVVGSGSGSAAGVVAGNVGSFDQLLEITAAADEAARQSGPAPDADDLAAGDAASDWDEPPGETSIEIFTGFAAGLGEAFGRARDANRVLYGYVEHDMTTTYLGSSTGLRRRHQQPTGHVGITGKDASLTRSAWAGAATRDFDDVDALVLDAELNRRLSWADRHVDLPAGRYDTILPPAAIADLQIYAHWSSAARDADDGRSVYSKPGSGTRVGEQIMNPGVRILSDPAYPGLECQPFVTAGASSAASSVFDNGLPVARTEWVSDGRLAALLQTRESARITDLAYTPGIDNLVLEIDGATGTIDDEIGRTERGLLLTCLWYIRAVDEQTLLLTGLTRDGVYLVEHGEVTAAVNNFRFNESPIDLLNRFGSATASVPTISREWGDYFSRTAMPAVRIPDFNMSSVSQAS